MTVGLVVNSYERTYRTVLAPGYFPGIVKANLRPFDEIVALINNVEDRTDATDRAEDLVARGDITSYAFVSDYLDFAMKAARLKSRALRLRPYLLDYGLVLPHVLHTDWLVGWDAETRLVQPINWINPSLDLMQHDSRIFHTSVNWPPARPEDAGIEGDMVGVEGDFLLSWGFSDQLFLLRRHSLIGDIYKTFSPAAIARHAPHPYTFEFRVESHQRSARKLRATFMRAAYETNLTEGGVLDRTGKTLYEDLRRRVLHRFEQRVTRRLPSFFGPRLARNAGVGKARM